MSSLDKIFKEEMQKMPRIYLTRLIRNKFEEMGVPEKEGLIDALIEYIESDSEEKFLWCDDDDPDSNNQNYQLVITEEDMDKFEDDISTFLKSGLRNVVETTADDTSRDILQSLKDKWPEVDEYEQTQSSRFKANLEKRWGQAFSALRMMHSISRDMGGEEFEKYSKFRTNKNRTIQFVILKLHARACQVGGEIITLIQNGYADGAMARWRTLHELVIVASVLVHGGEELAKRYVDHEIIDSKAEMDEFQRCCKELGLKPTPYRERQRIKKEYSKAIKKYGANFRFQYGWVAEHLKMNKPMLNNLAESVSHSHMRTYYKLASQNVHASSKRLFNSLSSIDDEFLMLAGTSNVGFEEPAENTAYSLVQISSLLKHDRMEKLDVIVELKSLLHLRKEISNKFAKAARTLKHDHMSVLENFE